MPDTTVTDHVRAARLSLAGLLVNAGLAMVKLISGLVGHSYALVADAVESMADICGSIIVWHGVQIAAQPPDDEHPYGHGKAEPLAALIVGLMLVGAAVGIAIEAVREILAPHHLPAPFTLGVLIGVVIIKETMFRIVLRTGKEIDNRAVLADAWHHRSDAITSVAAGIGISVALIGGEPYAPADDWAALLASGVIFYNACRLILPTFNELMDAEPTVMIERIRLVAEQVPGVGNVEKIYARKCGMRYWVDMHMGVSPEMSVHRAHEIAHDVKDQVRGSIPQIHDVLIHIEPFGEQRA